MTPAEKTKAIKQIKALECDIACARQELQFSPHKNQIRDYIGKKEAEIETIKKLIEKSIEK